MSYINFVNVLTPVYALKVAKAEKAVRAAEMLRDRAQERQRQAEQIALRVDAVVAFSDLMRAVRPEWTADH